MLWSAVAAGELESLPVASGPEPGRLDAVLKGRTPQRAAVRSQVRVDGAALWSRLDVLEDGSMKSLSLLPGLKPASPWPHSVCAIKGRPARIRFSGHMLSMSLIPPQVRPVSHALLMHIQCTSSAGVVQV
jgi:hypothetical protein